MIETETCDICEDFIPLENGRGICDRCERNLRDKFAMAALTGFLADGGADVDSAARFAYIVADRMLEERKRQKFPEGVKSSE